MKPTKTFTREELQNMEFSEIEEKIVPLIPDWKQKTKRFFMKNSLKMLAIQEYLKLPSKVDDKATTRDNDKSPVGQTDKRTHKVA